MIAGCGRSCTRTGPAWSPTPTAGADLPDGYLPVTPKPSRVDDGALLGVDLSVLDLVNRRHGMVGTRSRVASRAGSSPGLICCWRWRATAPCRSGAPCGRWPARCSGPRRWWHGPGRGGGRRRRSPWRTPDGFPYQVQQFVDGRPAGRLDRPVVRALLEVIEKQAGLAPPTDRDWSAHVHRVVFDDESDPPTPSPGSRRPPANWSIGSATRSAVGTRPVAGHRSGTRRFQSGQRAAQWRTGQRADRRRGDGAGTRWSISRA